jgi:hypothetical protein
LLSPSCHSLLYERSSGSYVAAGGCHGLTDCTSESRAQVQLWRHYLHVHTQLAEGTPHGAIAYEGNTMASLSKGQHRGNERLEVTAGTPGGDDQELFHVATVALAAHWGYRANALFERNIERLGEG